MPHPEYALGEGLSWSTTYPAFLGREVISVSSAICFDAITRNESCSRWKLSGLSQVLKPANFTSFQVSSGQRIATRFQLRMNPEVRNQKSHFSSQSGYHRKPLSLDVRESNEDSGNWHSTGSFWIPKISMVTNRPTLNHGNMSLHYEEYCC